MKKIKVLIGLTLIFSIQTFSQVDTSEKMVFAYKKVQGFEIKANIFLPDTNGLHPVLIYFHGGGFIFGNRDQGLDSILKEKLLSNNYAVVSADYRLAPETKLDEILNDVSDIVKWIKQNGEKEYNLDTSRIVTVGGSSGGYLALTTGFHKISAPNAIIAISSPTGFSSANIKMGDLSILNQPSPYDIVVKDSIVSYGDYNSRMVLWRFLASNRLALYEIFGFDPSIEPEKLERYKLTSNVKSGYPPTLIIQAKNDHLVELSQATAFYDFLQGNGVDSKLYLVENGHSSELIKQNPDAVDEIINFLNMQLKR